MRWGGKFRCTNAAHGEEVVDGTSRPSSSLVDQSVLHRLREAFAQIPDTRQPGKVLHRLDEVLLCGFCAILCDSESFTDMEDFAQSQLPWLRRF